MLKENSLKLSRNKVKDKNQQKDNKYLHSTKEPYKMALSLTPTKIEINPSPSNLDKEWSSKDGIKDSPACKKDNKPLSSVLPNTPTEKKDHLLKSRPIPPSTSMLSSSISEIKRKRSGNTAMNKK